jgi:hypothetical protein
MTSKPNQHLKTALLAGFFIACLWFSIGSIAGRRPPVSELDTPIYLQYARNMAEGHPFEYVQGDAPSTGCTGYLYPVLLALLYKAGCAGNAFITASFFLNAVFFLVSLLLIGRIARRLAPRFYPFVLAATLLSGQTLNAFFGQTDMGLLFMLVFFCFWAFLFERKICLLAGMLLAGLTHPTSASLAGGLLTTGALCFILHSGNLKEKPALKNSAPFWIGCAGVAAIALTLLFNFLLTGDFVFMSLRAKGLFKSLSPANAASVTLVNLVNLVRGVWFGIGEKTTRSLYYLPVVCGLVALAGILTRPWHKKERIRFDALVLLTLAAELILLSVNPQQGVSHDRYMAWVIPFIYLYAALFMEKIHQQPALHPAAPALAVLLILFQLASFTFFTLSYSLMCDFNAGRGRFAEEVLAATRPGDTLAMEESNGIMWYLPERKLLNPHGMFTAEFAHGRHWLCYVETLKYHPELHSSHWLVSDKTLAADPVCGLFLGDRIIRDTDSFGWDSCLALYAADWTSLRQSPPESPKGWSCRDRLDIGYPEDETKADYTFRNRLRGVKTTPVVDKDKTLNLTEMGQLVIGQEQFQPSNLLPGHPLHITLRSARSTEAQIGRYQGTSYEKFTFSSPLQLTVEVDERALDVELELAEEGFTDASFTVPAEYITRPNPEIRIIGDHVSYAYWFFQPQ